MGRMFNNIKDICAQNQRDQWVILVSNSCSH
jgi:hypothetical protein